MKQNDDADDDCGAHSLCGSSYYQPYSFTTLCAARKFMRGVKRDNNQGGIQGSLLHDRVHPHQSEFEEGGGISSTSPPRHAFCGNPSPLPSPSSNNIAYSTNSSPHRPGILSQSNLESRTRFWKSPHRCRHNYRAMTDLEEKCCVDNDVGFEVSEGKPPTLRRDFIELKNLIISNWIYLFILLMPAAILSKHLQLQDSLTFSLSAITLMPLASLLAEFTEELSFHSNQCMAGLINASFGNAVEVIVALQALRADQIRIVQASLIGSVFSNMLLVLGSCFFCGGLKYKEQYFNTTSALANMNMLLLSGIALLLPTPLALQTDSDCTVLFLSRVSGGFLLFMYIQLLIFQLRTHCHMFESDELANLPKFTLSSSLLMLCVVTLSVVLLSNILVGSLDGFISEAKISTSFVGIVIIPIIGNAVEHMTAVSVAMKGKLDLAIGVAIGSATQISMFVVPVCLIAGWILDKDMTLKFPLSEVSLYIMSVLVVGFVTSSGTSNWLMGSLLISSYILCCLAFWDEGDRNS